MVIVYERYDNCRIESLSLHYDLDIKEGDKVKTDTTVGGWSYQYKPGMYYKQSYLYRSLYKDFSYLKIYEVKIDEYLKDIKEKENFIIYELSKDYVAEVLLAFDTDYYNSGLDRRVYNYSILIILKSPKKNSILHRTNV